MNRKFWLGSLAIAAIAVPALAQIDDARERPERGAVMTRGDVEERIKDRFGKLDLNRDGSVTKEEAEQAREARLEERQDRRFARLDADKNGSISRAEFDAAADARAERPKRSTMMRRGGMEGGLFARADANDDGRVTLSEALAPAMDRFNRADANRDGTVTREERREMRQERREERPSES